VTARWGWELGPRAGLRVESAGLAGAASVAVAWLSIESIWVKHARPVTLEELALTLRDEDFEVELRVRVRDRAGGLLRLDFIEPGGRTWLGPLVERLVRRGAVTDAATEPALDETVSNPWRIDRLLAALFEQEAPAEIVASNGRVTHTAALRLTPGAELACAWPVAEDPGPPPYHITAVGYGSVARFRVLNGSWWDGVLSTPRPARIERSRFRSFRRSERVHGTMVRFEHPAFPGRSVVRPVLDASLTGLRAEHVPAEDLLYAGLELPRLEVLCDGRRVFVGAAEVRVLRQESDAMSVGLRLHMSEDAQASWLDFVQSRAHPEVRSGSFFSMDVWELFEKSGYFNLSERTPAHFAALRRNFAHAQGLLERAPGVGSTVVWPSEDGVDATVSAFKIYRHTWLGCHMAKRRGLDRGRHGGELLREVHYRAFEDAAFLDRVRWVAGFIQVRPHFSSVAISEFTARCAEGGEGHLQRFRAVQVMSDWRFTSGGRATVEVRELDPREHRLLADAVRRERPAAYCDALDMTASALDMTPLTQELAAVGMARERVLLGAYGRRGLEAVAVLELGEPGLHIFGLLDTVRVFGVAGRPQRKVVNVLLSAAGTWYAGRGRERFVFFDEHGVSRPDISASFIDLGLADLTLFAGRLLPDFLDHLFEISTPRSLRGSSDDT